MESIAQSDDVNTISDDDHSYMNDSAADGQEQPTKSLDSHLCQSACCSDVTKPYQPTNKHLLSVMTNGDRNFIARWYTTYNWLTLCTERKKAFCFYSRFAQQKGILTFSSKAEPVFTSIGFNNWRKAIAKFKNHTTSSAHAEAVLKWQMQQVSPINTQL